MSQITRHSPSIFVLISVTQEGQNLRPSLLPFRYTWFVCPASPSVSFLYNPLPPASAQNSSLSQRAHSLPSYSQPPHTQNPITR